MANKFAQKQNCKFGQNVSSYFSASTFKTKLKTEEFCKTAIHMFGRIEQRIYENGLQVDNVFWNDHSQRAILSARHGMGKIVRWIGKLDDWAMAISRVVGSWDWRKRSDWSDRKGRSDRPDLKGRSDRRQQSDR